MLGKAVPTMVWSSAASSRVRRSPHTVSARLVREGVTFLQARSLSLIVLSWIRVLPVVRDVRRTYTIAQRRPGHIDLWSDDHKTIGRIHKLVSKKARSASIGRKLPASNLYV